MSQDFFDYVLQGASEPVGKLLGNMDPYAGQQSGMTNFDPYGQTGSQLNFDPYGGGGGFGFNADPYSGGAGDQTGIMAQITQAGAQFRQDQAAAQAKAQAQAAAQTKPAQAGPTQDGVPSGQNTRITNKIRQVAASLGIDPDFAVWVAEVEGGVDDAAAARPNQQGSGAYGPYQLLIGGGLGDAALAAGIDPRDPNTWERQIEFALQHAAQNGWGAWEAVTARGIDPRTGIPGGVPAPRAPTSATSGAPQAAPAAASGTPQGMPSGSAYAQYQTVAPSQYQIAFDFDAPYDNPFNPDIPNHRGVDITVKGAPNNGRGSRVGAFHPGTVVYTAVDPNGGSGVIILGDDGVYHRYFHFDEIHVQNGQRVERGVPLGSLGASGTEGFPHLHYEVSRGVNGDPMGQTIDPRPYLQGAN